MPVADQDLDNLVTDEGEEDPTKTVDRGDALEIDDADAGEDGDKGKTADKDKPAAGNKTADAEADPDEEEEEEGEEAAGGKAKAPTMVPRARLNQAIEKQRAAEARITALEEKLRATEDGGKTKQLEAYTQKLDSLYEEAEKARAEGDYKAAAKLQRELDTLKETATSEKSVRVAQEAAVRTQMVAAYNAVVDQAEALEPRLNPKSDDYDPVLASEVVAVSAGFEHSGKRPADALKKALRLVLGTDIFAAPELRKTAVAPKKTDLKKNIDAAKKTPPKSQEGAAPEKQVNVDVSKLSDEEFDKLPEATKRRMRGDFME